MTKEQLFKLAIEELPTAIGFVKGIIAARHPTEPLPSDAEVLNALHAACTSSIAQDDAWLAAHPIL